MKKLFGMFIIATLFLGMISLVFAQDSTIDDEEPPMIFELVNEIGRAVPRNMLYNIAMDQYMVVDAYNRMTLVDGQTFTTQHVIYESGNYADFAFNNAGTLLAIVIDSRIELWDTQTGERVARLTELGEPQRIEAPITFSRDDTLLIFEGVYPAPRSIRIFEGQTITVPWIWHIPSALDVNTSNFPGRAEAWQFFDYRNGLVIAPDNRLVAALPSRIQVLNSDTLEVLFEIPTDRYENDPMVIQFSARDDQIYFQPNTTNTIVQVDTERGVLTEIPLETGLTESDLELLGGIQLSRQARRIGNGLNDLNRVFLPTYPDELYDSGQLSVTLIDLIVPPISQGDNIRALLFIYNERTELGYFRLTSGGAQQIILNADEDELILRLFPGNDERIVTYNLDTGQQLRSFIPSLRGIGRYSRISKNRVLAFNSTNEILVSDFQRYDAETNEVIVEDLTYSRNFEDFFIAPDNESIVTRSGNEWRVWDTATREVVRREVLPLSGSFIAVAPDGYRWLSRISGGGVNNPQSGVEIIDLNNDALTVTSVLFDNIAGSSVGAIYPNRAWTHFLIEYSVNGYGEYAPGNQIAVYSMEDGFLWHIAGDDLPPPNGRNYGWVDEETVFITGTGYDGEQPARIFGVDYDLSRVPQCIVDAIPEQIDDWRLLWENRLYYLRNDQLNNLALLICRESPQTVQAVQNLLVPTPTQLPITVTPIVLQGVPLCLTIAYANDLDDYVSIWNDMVEGLDQAQRDEMETIVCEGLGDPELPIYRPQDNLEQYTQTMFVDLTGERSTGAFTPEERIRRPIQPVIEAFEEQYERPPGQVVLSPDGSLIATSNLPGELIVYRIIDGYEDIMVNVTATAIAIQEARNWVYPEPSATPPFIPVGTARPTLTPTTPPTPMPNPDLLQLEQSDQVEQLCPAETLFTMSNLPDDWSPNGVIATQIQDNVLWRINPITGSRAPDETLPQCFEGVECSFSPDRQWILASTSSTVSVIRPDGTDSRGLWDAEDLDDDIQDFPFRDRPSLSWWNGNTLQWQTAGYDENNIYRTYINRDILGVFPDPDPIIVRDIVINNIVAEPAFQITASVWTVARIPFSTGTGLIYQYYLYNTETLEWVMFARQPNMIFSQDALGTRLFYSYGQRNNRAIWNQIHLDSVGADIYQANELPAYADGAWSNDGRYRIGRIDNRAYPLQLWDSQTGLVRRYCIPQTGARLYEGGFLWSPDHRYVALHAFLPEDEADEGVGQHLLILDIETGAIVDVTTGISSSMFWVAEGYE